MKIIVEQLLEKNCWHWYIIAANGAVIAQAPTIYTRKWSACRAARQLIRNFNQGYFELEVIE